MVKATPWPDQIELECICRPKEQADGCGTYSPRSYWPGAGPLVHSQALCYRPNNSRGSRSSAGSGALSQPGFPIDRAGGRRTGNSLILKI
jgi:hypothetical protein